MDENYKHDHSLSEPSELADNNSHDRKGSMSLGAGPNANGDEVSPINGESVTGANGGSPVIQDPNSKAVNDVISSEVCQAIYMFSGSKLKVLFRLEFQLYLTVSSKA